MRKDRVRAVLVFGFCLGAICSYYLGMAVGRVATLDAIEPVIVACQKHVASIRVDIESAQDKLTSIRALLVERGRASYYGKWHNGKKMSNGQKFDMYALTAASLRWPLGTRVKVTSIKTGLSVVVPITDRGPYVAGRIIDLSVAAAQTIGMEKDGIHYVKVEPILD
jgi:rare lipoprotein A (peptidoglycan hydrolase)